MKQEELIKIMIGVAKGIAKVEGRDTEVAVHDLHEMQMVFIANGNITGREVGTRMDKSIYKMILRQSDDDGHMIAYRTMSEKGKRLRSSHFIIRDEKGEPAVLICINQDDSKLEERRDYINYKIHVNTDEEECSPGDGGGNIIQSVAQNAIMNSIWKMTTGDLDTKEGKITLLKELKRQGIFDVRATTPYICKALSISQTTLYNYLREIKNEGEDDSTPVKLK